MVTTWIKTMLRGTGSSCNSDTLFCKSSTRPWLQFFGCLGEHSSPCIINVYGMFRFMLSTHCAFLSCCMQYIAQCHSYQYQRRYLGLPNFYFYNIIIFIKELLFFFLSELQSGTGDFFAKIPCWKYLHEEFKLNCSLYVEYIDRKSVV